jgi:hypothetical protein
MDYGSYKFKLRTFGIGSTGPSGAVRAFLEYSQVNFFTVYLDFGRCRDSDTYLTSFHAQYCNVDIITDDQALPNPSCQYEHTHLPMVSDTSCANPLLHVCNAKRPAKEPSLADHLPDYQMKSINISTVYQQVVTNGVYSQTSG